MEIKRMRQLKIHSGNKKDQDLLGNSNRKNQGKSLDLYFSNQTGDARRGTNTGGQEFVKTNKHVVHSLRNVRVWTGL